MNQTLSKLAIVVALCFASKTVAQQATPSQPPQPETSPPAQPQSTQQAADDPTGVKFALGRYTVVFNSHDPKALAALWTPGGVYVNRTTGERTEGREALEADFTELFASSPDVKLSGEVTSVRPLTADAAMVEGITSVVIPDSEPAESAYSAIFIKHDGKWLLDSVHETDVPQPETSHDALKVIEWLVGSWQDDSDAVQVATQTRWTPSEAFLLRSYQVTREDEEPFEGTQIIGWDPIAKQIRSWTFNSDGSFGEGDWSKNGESWLVRTTQTLPDGRVASGTQVIEQQDADTVTVATIAKEIDGAPEPVTDPVTMRRIIEPATAEPPQSTKAAVAPAPAVVEAGQ